MADGRMQLSAFHLYLEFYGCVDIDAPSQRLLLFFLRLPV